MEIAPVNQGRFYRRIFETLRRVQAAETSTDNHYPVFVSFAGR
jgi:hypothetical protein